MRFFSVTKPGIIFGNIVTVSGGYFLGSRHFFNIWHFLFTLLGMSLIIAAGCVLNNYIDRDIDSLMERTKNRVLVTGLISGRTAIVYAFILGLAGLLVLYVKTNPLTVGVAFIGLFFYVVIYSLYFKRRSTLGTLIGGIAGAVPPVVGYCAVTNRFDAGAIILFLILFFWQMPHFYAIAIYRIKDFSAAAIPVLPITKNIQYTKISMLLYVIAFTIVAVLPTLFGYIGWLYFTAALVLGFLWLNIAIQGFTSKNDKRWARKMFGFSILNITLLSLFMAMK